MATTSEQRHSVAPTSIPNYSGFDKSHRNLFTGRTGTLIPALCDPVIPGTRVSLKASQLVNLIPLASDTYMNVDFRAEAFFVPAAACYGGFNDFVTRRQTNIPGTRPDAVIPGLALSSWSDAALRTLTGPGTLLDYLGIKAITQIPDAADKPYMPMINPLPIIAYHRIYDRFYRNSLISKPLFSPPSQYSNRPTISGGAITYERGYMYTELPWLRLNADNAGNIPCIAFDGAMDQSVAYPLISPLHTSDGSELVPGSNNLGAGTMLLLHQRHFGADYFTTATPTAQRGNPSAVEFNVNLVSGDGSISIAAIRTANALQLFREKNNLIDDDIHSYDNAHYGVSHGQYGEYLPQYLGRFSTPVYSNGVQATAELAGSVTKNPFTSVGTTFGKAQSNSPENMLIDNFEAPCYGYIFVIVSLVPQAQYSTGIRRHLLELVGNRYTDIPDAILQQVGPQEVYAYELNADMIGNVSPTNPDGWKQIFGYQQRFAHYMEHLDEVHGFLRDGEQLEAFALQRSFYNAPGIGGSFLPIPPNYLDQVSVTTNNDFEYWADMYFDYKVSMPLSAYSIPTLENPAGHTEFVRRAGFKI